MVSRVFVIIGSKHKKNYHFYHRITSDKNVGIFGGEILENEKLIDGCTRLFLSQCPFIDPEIFKTMVKCSELKNNYIDFNNDKYYLCTLNKAFAKKHKNIFDMTMFDFYKVRRCFKFEKDYDELFGSPEYINKFNEVYAKLKKN